MKTLQFFTANWCPTCKAMKICAEDVCKLENCHLEIIDLSNGDADGSGITQLPYFKIINKHNMVERTASGAMQRVQLQKFIRG